MTRPFHPQPKWTDKRPIRSRCRRTGKVGYKSHDAAMLAGSFVLDQPDCRVRSFRAYLCQYCGLWHLTSQE